MLSRSHGKCMHLPVESDVNMNAMLYKENRRRDRRFGRSEAGVSIEEMPAKAQDYCYEIWGTWTLKRWNFLEIMSRVIHRRHNMLSNKNLNDLRLHTTNSDIHYYIHDKTKRHAIYRPFWAYFNTVSNHSIISGFISMQVFHLFLSLTSNTFP